MADLSPLQIYADTLSQTREMMPKFDAAAEEQRRGYDQGMGEINRAYAPDTKSGLRALSASLLRPAQGGFNGQLANGLDALNKVDDRERGYGMDRASKIAALQEARSRLSQQALEQQSALLRSQGPIAQGIHGIQTDDRNFALEKQDRDAWTSVVKSLGDGALLPNSTPAERAAVGAAGYRAGPALLSSISQRDDKPDSPEGRVAADMGYKKGTSEYNEVVLRLQRGEDLRPNSQVHADNEAMAQRLGIPAPEIDPFRGLSPANQQKTQMSLRQQADKRLEQAYAAAQAAQGENGQLDRFAEINKRDTRTGPGWNLLPNVSSDSQEMAGISTELSRKQRQAGEGTISDFDAKQFTKMVPSTNNSPDVNQKMVDARKAANEMSRDRATFMNDYYRAYGHLEGADGAWLRYANANTIFDVNKPDQINKKRMNYRDYFNFERGQRAYGRQAPGQPEGTATQAPAAGNSGAAPDPLGIRN